MAARLGAMLEANADGLVFTALPTGAVRLERPPATTPQDYVAGTRIGKSYVSYYLMPVYGLPELLADIPPALRRRMQGKACFNFTKVDEALFAELEASPRPASPASATSARPPARRDKSEESEWAHAGRVTDLHLGRIARALRHRLGWRQIDVALRASVSQARVSMLERGRVENLSVGMLRRVLQALDADLVMFMAWRRTRPAPR